MHEVTAEDVDKGFELLYNFSLVQRESSMEELQEAFGLLLLSLGLEEEAREHLYNCIYDYMSESSIVSLNPFAMGLLVLGIIVGIGIDQNAASA